jgi:hypothetical protein
MRDSQTREGVNPTPLSNSPSPLFTRVLAVRDKRVAGRTPRRTGKNEGN